MFRVDYAAALPTVDRRDDGTLRVAANLTRTGVLQYAKPDGSPWREYRPPEEVFAPASLASYGGRPLTIGHRLDAVTADKWSDVAVGDVRDDAHKADKFVRATVQVSDAKTIERLGKDLIEVSCGYRCDLDNTPGISPDGEPYDAIQRNIRLNHVALLPANKGRAGRDVRLLLDSDGNVLQETQDSAAKITHMADEINLAQVQKDRADALDRESKAKNEAEALKGELAALKAQAAQIRADAEAAQAKRPSEVAARVALIDVAKKYLPTLRADSSDSDDKIKRDVIAKINPALKCDDNASAAYVDGVFNSLVATTKQDGGRKAVEAAIASVPVQANQEQRTDQGEDVIKAARERCHSYGRKAWTMRENDVMKLQNENYARSAK